MVSGIESFKEWFSNYSDQYAIIGGTACDLLMSKDGLDFRATRDIDMVLIVESLTLEFGIQFWKFVVTAGYEHINKSTDKPQFYRFSNPKNRDCPYMIELFSRRNEALALPDDAVLTPLTLDEELSSLSAILMDNDYYQLLLDGRILMDGISILDAGHLIPFKAKAWLDLSARKASGGSVDSRNIRKHKNDVFRLSALLTPDTKVVVPDSVYGDLTDFFSAMELESVDLAQFGIHRQSKEAILEIIAAVYVKQSSGSQ